ncbi:MAG: hypothetical protein AAFN78_05845 [Pseudomonadota bacterium]
MNVLTTPRATALAVSSAMFVMQLVAFGTGAEDPAVAVDCPDAPAPSAITVPPVAPEPPAFSPVVSENHSVSI